MNAPSSRRASPIGIALAAMALALVAYYFWPRSPNPAPANPGQPVVDPAQTPGAGAGSALANAANSPYRLGPDGKPLRTVDGVPVPKEPWAIASAKPIPVEAAPGQVIGYTVDAQGNSKPVRAGEAGGVPANTPGSFAVVDMWADGGPAVVPATEGQHLSPAEYARLHAQEEARDKSQQTEPPR